MSKASPNGNHEQDGAHFIDQKHVCNSDTEVNGSRDCRPDRPITPNPSQDPGVVPPIQSLSIQNKKATEIPQDENFDVATLEPIVALGMLDRGIQALADLTGDIPPTPPISRPTTPTLKDLRAGGKPEDGVLGHRRTPSRPVTPSSAVSSHDIRAPTFQRVEIGSPEAHLSEPTVIENIANRRVQNDAISRKFFSRKPPQVSIHDYLLRMHRYCPMSTAVILAAGVYIHRLAVEENSVPVTSRTVHRLLLACLRVAMKALEDLSYPHQRFAGVGGVSEKELAKLEISLCYLMDFDLKVDNALLYEKTRALQQFAHAAKTGRPAVDSFKLALPSTRNTRRVLT